MTPKAGDLWKTITTGQLCLVTDVDGDEMIVSCLCPGHPIYSFEFTRFLDSFELVTEYLIGYSNGIS